MKQILMEIFKQFKNENILIEISQEPGLGVNLNGMFNGDKIIYIQFLNDLWLSRTEDDFGNIEEMTDYVMELSNEKKIEMDKIINILIHEFGHYLSLKKGLLTKENSINFFKIMNDQLYKPTKQEIEDFQEEESIAWELGGQFFKFVKYNKKSFEENRTKNLNNYKNRLETIYSKRGRKSLKCATCHIIMKKRKNRCYKCVPK